MTTGGVYCAMAGRVVHEMAGSVYVGYIVYRGCSVGDRFLFLYRFYLCRINLG